jgi:hypothetical protein
MDGPTAADFEALAARATAYNELDKGVMEAIRGEYHLKPPSPYDELLSQGNIQPTTESHRAIAVEIDADPSLSPEQKSVLQHELSERWQSSILAQHGEGHNF